MYNIILKEYRHIKYLSQEELSYQLEVSTNHIRNIELGKIYPSEKLIQKIIKCIATDSELLTKPISSETLGCLFLLCQSRSLTDNHQALIYGQMQSILDCLQKTRKPQIAPKQNNSFFHIFLLGKTNAPKAKQYQYA